MVDQKVAIIIAVCLLIISFVWRPGAWVRISENYEVDRPFRIKVGNQYAYLNDSNPNDPNARFWLTPDVSRAGIFRARPTPDGYTTIMWNGNGADRYLSKFLSHRGNNNGWVYADAITMLSGSNTVPMQYHWKEDNGKLVPHINGKGTRFENDDGVMKLKVVDIQQADTFQFEYVPQAPPSTSVAPAPQYQPTQRDRPSEVPGIPFSFMENLKNTTRSANDVRERITRAGYASQLESWMRSPDISNTIRDLGIGSSNDIYEQAWELIKMNKVAMYIQNTAQSAADVQRMVQEAGYATQLDSWMNSPTMVDFVRLQNMNPNMPMYEKVWRLIQMQRQMELGPGTISGGVNITGQTTQPMPIPGVVPIPQPMPIPGTISGGPNPSGQTTQSMPIPGVAPAPSQRKPCNTMCPRGMVHNDRCNCVRPPKSKNRSSYVQPEQPMAMMTSSTDDDYEPHNYCDSAWWSGSCSASADLDFEAVGTPLDRPRDQPVPTENEYAPMSPDGSRRVLGSDGPKETLPFTSAWDNTNEINTENGGSASLSQTQLAQIRGSAAADLLGMDIQFPTQPMRPGIPA